MKEKNVIALASVAVLAGAFIGGCGTKTVETNKGPDGQPTTVNGVPVDSAKGPQNGDTKDGAGTPTGLGPDAKAITAVQQLPQVADAQRHLDLSKMPDTLTIMTVDGTPITVGDYRRQFKMQSDQVRAQLSVNQDIQRQLLSLANQNHITLADVEKKELLETSKKAMKATGGVLQKYLDANHMTEKQFDDEVLKIGLAQKAAAMRISQGLLGDLVDRELLCAAARSNGLGSTAFNKFTEFKKSPEYADLIKSGALSEDQIKDEVIRTSLTQLMIQKIQDKAQVTDQQITDVYNKYKDKLKHGERIRLSQIFIAAPKVDSAAGESIKTRLKKENPKMSDAELDAQAKVMEQQLSNRAEEILARALKGEDFAKLANENTDDIPVKAAKLGGDMGFQDKDKLMKDFVDKVGPLKPGTVYPKVIPSQLGFHIVKLTEKQPPGTVPLAEVKEQLKHGLSQRNGVTAVVDWLYDKRKAAQINLSPEFQKLSAAQPKAPAAAANASKVD